MASTSSFTIDIPTGGGMMGLDKRQAPRVARHFIARYRVLDAAEKAWSVSPLRDVSERGAHFLCEAPLAVGTVLEMQVVLPTVEESIGCLAKVAWAKPVPGGRIDLGVAFEPMEPASREAINQAVQHFLKRQRRAR